MIQETPKFVLDDEPGFRSRDPYRKETRNLIRSRIEKPIKNRSLVDIKKLLPIVQLPPVCTALFKANELWNVVDGVKYIPDILVKDMIVRKDGLEKDEKRFSVFVGEMKEKMKKNWGIVPLAAKNKQRNQFWDEGFVYALFVNIVFANQHPSGKWNKIKFTISNTTLMEYLEVRRDFLLEDLFNKKRVRRKSNW